MNYKFKTKPYEHQLKALERSWDKEYFAYFMEMGTGKTKVLIDNLAMLYDKGKVNGALIIASKGVVGTWYNNELPNHLPDHIEQITVLWKSNITKKQQEDLDTLFSEGEGLHILIMNVEALSTDKGLKFAEKFLSCHETLIAIDESTTIKNPGAKRTKNIVALGKAAKYRRILTGSPVTKSPLDLFSQCAFLHEELLESGSYYSFKNRYAVMKPHNFGGRRVQLVHSYQRLDELADILKGFSYRVLKEDCLDLPDKVYIKREVELSKEQKEAYSTMKSAALASLKGKMATAPHVLTQMMRLHQITCGHLKNDDGTTTDLKNGRIDELIDRLDVVEGKVIIWANYIHDIEALVKTISKEYGEETVVQYYGKTSSDDRAKAIKSFQDPKSKVKYFIGNPQTAGYGITLTEAGTVVYFSNGYDLEKRLQSEDRAHRIGQKKSVTYVDFIAPKTVDEKIVKALRNKIDIASQVMGEELKEWI